MKTRLLLCASLVFLFFCCDRLEKPEKPDDLISKAMMADILQDVYILNAAKGTNRDVLEENGVDPEKFLLDKYGVDSARFAMSNEYYAFDIKTYEEILNTVKERLQVMKDSLTDEMNKENERAREERDSIKRSRDSLKGLKNDSIIQKIKQPVSDTAVKANLSETSLPSSR